MIPKFTDANHALKPQLKGDQSLLPTKPPLNNTTTPVCSFWDISDWKI
jgi:hypothetical protein